MAYNNNDNLKGRSPFSHINVDTTYSNNVGTVSSELIGVLEELGGVVDGKIEPLFLEKNKA